MNRPISQVLDRHLPLDQFQLEDLNHGFEFVIVGTGERDLLFLFIQFDRRLRVLQIVARRDLFHGLLDGVVHLRHLNLRYDIKAVVRH